MVAPVDGRPQVTDVGVAVLPQDRFGSWSVRFSMPWSDLKWYFTQNFSPPAFCQR